MYTFSFHLSKEFITRIDKKMVDTEVLWIVTPLTLNIGLVGWSVVAREISKHKRNDREISEHKRKVESLVWHSDTV